MRLLVSCISTQHSTLKQHWSQTKEQTACSLTVLGSHQKPEGDLGGALCLLDNLGCTQKTLDLSMVAGMVSSEQGVLITTFNAIHEVDCDLRTVRSNRVTSPLFNALYSLSRTHRGYIVASSGIDLLVEFNREGKLI